MVHERRWRKSMTSALYVHTNSQGSNTSSGSGRARKSYVPRNDFWPMFVPSLY